MELASLLPSSFRHTWSTNLSISCPLCCFQHLTLHHNTLFFLLRILFLWKLLPPLLSFLEELTYKSLNEMLTASKLTILRGPLEVMNIVSFFHIQQEETYFHPHHFTLAFPWLYRVDGPSCSVIVHTPQKRNTTPL